MSREGAMRRIILFDHVSLDGFAATKDKKIDWVTVNEAIFEYANELTSMSDAALYGRGTYEIMQAYWPDAGKKPGATKHDRQHSEWYNRVVKYVMTDSMKAGSGPGTELLRSSNAVSRLKELKAANGKNILMLGSPTAAHSLMKAGLIDEYRFCVNPVILGKGVPVFGGLDAPIKLKLTGTARFEGGGVALTYEKDI